MNLKVSLYIEAIKIAGNAIIIFKGNLVAGCIMLYRTSFWPHFIVLKNSYWLVNFYYW